MVSTATPIKALSGQEQAAYFHARERRRSLAGMPELFRSRRIVGSGVMAVADAGAITLANAAQSVTFKTAIAFGPGVHNGLVFEFGSTARGAALWVAGQTLNFRAGAALAADRALAVFDNGAVFPDGVELDIVAAVRPGVGLVQLWLQGRTTVRDQASNLNFGTPSSWTDTANGSFAAAVQGTTPADVTQTAAPTNFSVIEPLSVYIDQHPRQMTLPA